MKKFIDLKGFLISLVLISVISLLLSYFTNISFLPAFIIGAVAVLLNGIVIAFTKNDTD